MNQLYCYNLVLLIFSIQVIISTSEYLFSYQLFKDSGLISWEVNRFAHPKFARFIHRLGFNHLFSYPNYIFLLVFKLCIAVTIIFQLWIGNSVILLILLLALVSLLTIYRNYRSNNGADQMSGIVIAALALGKVASTKHSLDIALAFITAQALLAYGTSGFLKLTKAGWLNGTYVLEILKTSTFGNRKILDYFSKRIMLRFAASFIVVFGDILLSISVLFPPKICLCILLIGLCLHLGIAFVMGLNTFVWAFCATYPAIFYFSCKLYHQVYL